MSAQRFIGGATDTRGAERLKNREKLCSAIRRSFAKQSEHEQGYSLVSNTTAERTIPSKPRLFLPAHYSPGLVQRKLVRGEMNPELGKF